MQQYNWYFSKIGQNGWTMKNTHAHVWAQALNLVLIKLLTVESIIDHKFMSIETSDTISMVPWDCSFDKPIPNTIRETLTVWTGGPLIRLWVW